MRKELVETLSKMTEEEERIIRENGAISKELYTSEDDFVIDAAKLLEKGKLIAIRPHTRFAHFPEHRHNYIEMVLIFLLPSHPFQTIIIKWRIITRIKIQAII